MLLSVRISDETCLTVQKGKSKEVRHGQQEDISRRGFRVNRNRRIRHARIRREAPKPVNNLHAKISAARAEAIKFELERERARQSPISCWSNFGTLSTVAVAQSAPATVEQKSITIVNSNVTINQ